MFTLCISRKQGMDGQLYCESHAPTSPVSGPVSPTSPVVLNPGEEKKKVSLLFVIKRVSPLNNVWIAIN